MVPGYLYEWAPSMMYAAEALMAYEQFANNK